ncbi:hypothetical protein [Agromyces sp. NPDC049794]|uniref:hypothetical protein n=1 Tax=unclassified Agromyces TaxID=2639701 RepID=UPI0033DCA899
MDLAVLAGVMSTGLFVMSYLPMLVKAARTKDLASYSLANLAITNAGNAVHSIYVFSLPIGPIWFLHTFYLAASALMLIWFLRSRATRPPTRGSKGRWPPWTPWNAPGSKSMVQPSTDSAPEFVEAWSSPMTRAMTKPEGSTTR